MTSRNPLTVMLLSAFTGGIYFFYWLATVGNELRATGHEVPSWWYLMIPILGFVYVWRVAKATESLSRGEQGAGSLMMLLCVFPPAGALMAQKAFNGRALPARPTA